MVFLVYGHIFTGGKKPDSTPIPVLFFIFIDAHSEEPCSH